MKTVLKRSGLLLFLAVIGLTACDKHRISGNNHLVSETRDLSGFSQVKLSGSYDVEIYRDSIFRIEVLAEENLLPYIETHVDGDVLHARTRRYYNLHPNYPVIVKVYMPVLTAIHLSGSGSMTADTFDVERMEADISGSGSIALSTNADWIDADISGSGDMQISGTAGESHLKISGSGSIRSANLVCERSFVKISGSGDMYVNVSDYLEVDISGSGNVYYAGHPQISTHISGSGELIPF